MKQSLVLFAIVSFALLPRSSTAAPTIQDVSIRGLRIGGKTSLVIRGSELLPEPRLVLPLAGASAELKPGGTDQQLEFDVTLEGGVPVGIHPLRVASSGGISNPVLVGVDELPQLAVASEVKELPVALHGRLSGGEVQRVKFAGRAGQAIVIDVESQRLGSKLRPVIRLLDPRGVQVAWSPGRATIMNDARCDTVLPVDGQYTIELHDMLYRGDPSGFFRLKIGDLHYADLAFPIGVQHGSVSTVSYAAGNLGGNWNLSSNFDLAAESAIRLSVPPQSRSRFHPLLLPRGVAATGAQPRILLSSVPELIEPPVGSALTLPALPLAINGRLAVPGEEDQYTLAVQPGAKLRVDVVARQVGSPLDGVLSIKGEQGNLLAANDDRPGSSDPGLEFTVPDGVAKIIVSIADLQKRGGPEFIYRVFVRDLSTPDFDLAISEDRLNLPAGGTRMIQLQVNRSGYNGPIRLTVEGLPDGVTLAGDQIPAGATIGLLTLTAPAAGPMQRMVQVVAQSVDLNPPLSRVARLAEDPASRHQPWLRDDLAMAIGSPAPLTVAWEPKTSDAPVWQGVGYAMKATVTRQETGQGDVRFRLVTAQPAQRKNVVQNNIPTMVDDVDRTLRLDGMPTVAAGTPDTELNLLVPHDLPGQPWAVVLVAELLSPDKKSVVASVTAPTRHVLPVSPLKLELASPPEIEARAGGGTTGQFTGKITRLGGPAQVVGVTLAGLPQGYPAPKVDVPADKSEFTFPVTFPFGTQAGELKNIQLVATSALDPAKAELAVRSNAIAVTLKVVPGEKQ